MAIIAFGKVDKKLIFLVFITIVRTINLLVSNETPEENSNGILCSLEEEVGPIIAGIILILIFRQKEKKVKKEREDFFKYLLILFLLRLVKSGYERIYPYIIKEKVYKFNNILNTINGVEIILITIGTFILLNYKYYIHHIISMLIYCALGITIDFILKNYSIMNFKYIYIYIVYIINEVLLFCYLKYMMDKLYYHYSEVILYWGITGFIVKIFIFSGMIIYEYENDLEGIIDGFKSYFAETKVAVIIFLQFFYYILDGAVYHSLVILMLYYLRPNHMIITDEIHVYIGLIFYKEKPNKLYTVIPFVFQILALIFYFEILEFNFWNLNINTIKNIQMREREEIDTRKSVPSIIELGDQYIINDDIDSKNNDDRPLNSSFKNNLSTDGMSPNNSGTDLLHDFEVINHK